LGSSAVPSQQLQVGRGIELFTLFGSCHEQNLIV
jgi:hypothetical protein